MNDEKISADDQQVISSTFVGLIPAAGLGSRLAPFAYPKELLPIIHTRDGAGGKISVRPVMQFSLDLLRRAGVTNCYIIISNWKFEIARMFEDGGNVGLSLSYIVHNTPRGLADAVNSVNNWTENKSVCMVLPDVIIQPQDSLHRVCTELVRARADVVLGVFPTSIPEQLGPVNFSPDGAVKMVLDKPKKTDLMNTWGVVAWSPVFTHYLKNLLMQGPVEITLGDAFQRALEDGLTVRAVHFPTGSFIDLGTPEAISAMIENRATVLDDNSVVQIPSV